MTLTIASNYVVETCCWDGCHVQWAFTRAYYDQVRASKAWWYCPNGHQQHYSGPSDAQKLKDSEARETALNDQLRAAIRDAEGLRSALVRDRARIANGVCPCCNRSFENVRRHMQTKHPDYGLVEHAPAPTTFRCSCGRNFDTYRGLRIHQGAARGADWDEPEQSDYWAHLTRT